MDDEDIVRANAFAEAVRGKLMRQYTLYSDRKAVKELETKQLVSMGLAALVESAKRHKELLEAITMLTKLYVHEQKNSLGDSKEVR